MDTIVNKPFNFAAYLSDAPRTVPGSVVPPALDQFAGTAPAPAFKARDMMALLQSDQEQAKAIATQVKLDTMKSEALRWKAKVELQRSIDGVVRDVAKNKAEVLVDRATTAAKAVHPEKPPAAPTESGVGAALRVGGGLVSVASGGFQLRQAAEELQDGKKGEAALSATEGTLNVAGGAALALGATTVGPVVLAGAAAVNGGRQLADGIQTGNTEKITLGSIKTGAAAMMGAAPFVSGTMIGAPVGLVMAGGGALVYGAATVYENRGKIAELAGTAVDAVRAKF